MRIVSRAEWGARPPQAVVHIGSTPRLWLHHIAADWTGTSGVRRTQDFHMDTRGYYDIAYNFLVDDDGAVYEGRGAGVAGAHTDGDNDGSHAIAAMGDFENRPPTRAMIASIAALVTHGHERGWWPDQLTGGHRDAPGASTLCPGRHLYAAIPDINALARQHTTPFIEEDDMAERLIALIADGKGPGANVYISDGFRKRQIGAGAENVRAWIDAGAAHADKDYKYGRHPTGAYVLSQDEINQLADV